MYLCLLGVKLLKYFLGLKQIQKIVQNTTGCHFPKHLVFGSRIDYLVVAWVSPWVGVHVSISEEEFILGKMKMTVLYTFFKILN